MRDERRKTKDEEVEVVKCEHCSPSHEAGTMVFDNQHLTDGSSWKEVQ